MDIAMKVAIHVQISQINKLMDDSKTQTYPLNT